MNLDDIWALPYYPIRDGQRNAINYCIDAIDSGYKNIILDAGTGVGKSAIAATLINYMNTLYNDIGVSYLVTQTKQLQRQYLLDYEDLWTGEPLFTEIKGRGNYPCNYERVDDGCFIDYVNNNNIIKEKIKLLKLAPDFDCSFFKSIDEETRNKYLSRMDMWRCKDCAYKAALHKAQTSPNVLSNYHYMWYAGVKMNNFNQRPFFVFDEAHSIENFVMDMVSCSLSRSEIYSKYDIDIFDNVLESSFNDIEYWQHVCTLLIDIISDRVEKDVKTLEKNGVQDNEIALYVHKSYSEIKDFLKIYENLSSNCYIIDSEITQNNVDKDIDGKLKVVFKPLYPTNSINDLLSLGNQRLFMTATLGNKSMFCRYMGLNEDDTAYYYLKSPFKKENRPIKKYYTTYSFSGKFNDGRKKWQTMESIKVCEHIINMHSNEHGVIHTGSNDQTDFIATELNKIDLPITIYPISKKSYHILNFGNNIKINRDLIIKRFMQDENPSVLIGAGIKEGVDFKGDTCTYQICAKIPYPYYGSKQVRTRADQDRNWYDYHTVVPLVQSYGRGVRTEDDFCVFYIIDRAFERVLSQNRTLLGEYFYEAILDEGQKIRKHPPAPQGNILKFFNKHVSK